MRKTIMTWYNLKEELGNSEFYKLILGANQHNYNYTIHTDMESLTIGYMGFNPSNWIGEEIKATYIV